MRVASVGFAGGHGSTAASAAGDAAPGAASEPVTGASSNKCPSMLSDLRGCRAADIAIGIAAVSASGVRGPMAAPQEPLPSPPGRAGLVRIGGSRALSTSQLSAAAPGAGSCPSCVQPGVDSRCSLSAACRSEGTPAAASPCEGCPAGAALSVAAAVEGSSARSCATSPAPWAMSCEAAAAASSGFIWQGKDG